MKKTGALENAIAMRADLTRRLKRVKDFIAAYQDFEREGRQNHYARKRTETAQQRPIATETDVNETGH